ncbi:hypothetical protein [Desulfurococcus amylolyticus]|uniref:hypothetical protein n=1 Tax=Desulfurococcus TaxID=2273 RepID=UPI0023F13C0F|nr:hypothetical protein [Desulfurococcus amylolyticus]
MALLRQRSIVFDGTVKLHELPFIEVEHGDILAKTVFVYVGQIERNIMNHNITPPGRIILGASGVVKAIETSGSNTSVTGRYITISPLSRHGILAYNVNGLLADYVSVKPEHVFEESLNANPYTAVKPFIAHGIELGAEAEGVTLIVGCNITAFSTALFTGRSNGEPILYCRDSTRLAQYLGLNIVSHVSNIPSRINTLVLTEPGADIYYRLLKEITPQKIVVSPFSFTTWIPINHRLEKTVITYKNTIRNTNPGAAENILHELSSFVKIIEIGDIEKTIGLLPPKELGSIIVLK